MKLTVRRELEALAPLAAKDQTRYALTGLRVEAQEDGSFRIDATDGRLLGTVTGASLNGHEPGVALLDAKGWKESFAAIRKAAKPKRGQEPEPVTVTAEGFQASASSGTVALELPVVEGRYPDVRQVEPKGPPAFTIRVNPEHLIRLLQAAEIATDDEQNGVTLEFYRPDTPLGVRAERKATGLAFRGLLMPLAPAA